MRPRQGLLVLLTAALVAACGCAAADEALTPQAWTAYLSSQGRRAGWAGTVRGVERGGPASAAETAAGAGEGDDFAALEAAAAADPAPHDAILPLGWIGSGRDALRVAALLAKFKAGGAEAEKKSMAADVAQLERRYRQGRLYWQIGNEINSAAMAHALGVAGDADNPAAIEVYAEYVFAPATEALRAASREVYGDPRHIKLMPGSIANAHRASSRRWLEQLLEYRIRGTCAPSLAGMRVADLVSVLAVHYVATEDDPPWETVFDELDRKWRAGGGIEGIWATEELGRRRAQAGLGAATALRVAAQYLSRAARLSLQPAALRCSFYGWRMGPADRNADAGLRWLLAAVGNGRVGYVAEGVRVDADGAAQAVVLDAGPRARAVLVFGRGDASLRLRSLRLPAGAGAAVALHGTLFGADAPRQLDFSVERSGTQWRYSPAAELRLRPGETLALSDAD